MTMNATLHALFVRIRNRCTPHRDDGLQQGNAKLPGAENTEQRPTGNTAQCDVAGVDATATVAVLIVARERRSLERALKGVGFTLPERKRIVSTVVAWARAEAEPQSIASRE